MRRNSKYASHDPIIKALISKTGKVDLFPNLKIPRTTALYWIEQGYEISDPLLDSLATVISESNDRELESIKLLNESKSVEKLLKEVFETFGHKLAYKQIESKEIREKILTSVKTALSNARLSQCLKAIDLSLSRYKRWKREKRGCGLEVVKFCPRYSQNQLTFNEIELMRDFVTSKKYSHFPVRSLHFYAKREGILFCTYSTWTKYIDQYGWLRPRKKRRKKYERTGIRAKHPNQIWHLDVSYFIFPDGKKAYIQAVIDNYSRYVLAWHILPSYDGAQTTTLLQNALHQSTGKKLSLIVDGGSENKGPGVKRLEDEGYFKKKVAQFEISFSNSIVEALFRSMKNNYLYHQEIKSFSSLKKHTDFWFKEYNEKIPHTSFSGETPLERFKDSWKMNSEVRIQVAHEEAMKLRIKHNKMVFCKLCDVA